MVNQTKKKKIVKDKNDKDSLKVHEENKNERSNSKTTTTKSVNALNTCSFHVLFTVLQDACAHAQTHIHSYGMSNCQQPHTKLDVRATSFTFFPKMLTTDV